MREDVGFVPDVFCETMLSVSEAREQREEGARVWSQGRGVGHL